MKERLTSGWHFVRWLRLIMGVLLAYQAVTMHEWLPGALAAFLLYQALWNVGCCGSNACASPKQTTDLSNTEDIVFEEIK